MRQEDYQMISEDKMQEIAREEAEKAAGGTAYDADDLLDNMKRHNSVLEMTEEGAHQFFSFYFREMAELFSAEDNEDH